MSDFFKGWRRKIGCVTLVMALVAMAGWVRSLLRQDIVSINVFPQQIAVESNLGTLHLFRYENFVIWVQRGMPPITRFQWENLDVSDAKSVVADRIASAASMSLSNYGWDAVSPSVMKCVVPYWSIVLPLTALAAYFLLSKPRKSNQMKIAEPIPDEGPHHE